jgi:hypothetical protein
MKKKTTFGISFPDPRLLEMAKIKAEALGMSLSAYVNALVRRDLNMPGAFGQRFSAEEASGDDGTPASNSGAGPAEAGLRAKAAGAKQTPTAPGPRRPGRA